VINPHVDLAAAQAGSDRLFMQLGFNPTVLNIGRIYDWLHATPPATITCSLRGSHVTPV
jgi:hypothetical protein